MPTEYEWMDPEMGLRPGWLKRAFCNVRREVKTWPQWKRDALVLDGEFPIAVEGSKGDE